MNTLHNLVPSDYLKQLTISLHKNGSTRDCDNYRGISLLSVPGKAFCKVIQVQLAKRAEQLLTEREKEREIVLFL